MRAVGIPFELTSAAVELFALLGAEHSLENLLGQVAQLALEVMPNAIACGVLVPEQGARKLRAVAATDPLAAGFDQMQCDVGLGPGHEALRAGEFVEVPDFAAEDRWPDLWLLTQHFSLGALISLPMRTRQSTIGVLTVFRENRREYSKDEIGGAMLFADQAALIVSTATTHVSQVELTVQMRDALKSRTTIDHSVGIIMAQNRCSPEAAYAILRAAANHRNAKLWTVAEEVVVSAQQSLPRADPGAGTPRATADGHASEQARLAAVRRYDILDTPPDGAFDRIAALAARLLGAPMATVSVVDQDRIWFKATHGLGDVHEVDLEPGLCSSAILQDEPYVVTDAATDPRTADNSLVHGDAGVRFYAAAPIITHDGYRLGTVNVLGTEARQISSEDLTTLQDLAAVVAGELELRVSAMSARQQHISLEAVVAEPRTPRRYLDADVIPRLQLAGADEGSPV